MSSNPPDMEQKTVETYRDGVLVDTRVVAEPKAPPSTAELQRQIAELEARLKDATAPLADVPGEEAL